MFRNLWSLFTLAAFVFAVPSAAFTQDISLSVDKEHMAGIVAAHTASLEGWRAGDVLIRYNKTGDAKNIRFGEKIAGVAEQIEVVGPDAMSVVTRDNSLFRLVFDFDDQRALVINRCEREERGFNGLDEEIMPARINVDDRVLLYDKTVNRAFTRLEAGVIHRVANNNLPPLIQMLHSMNVPDLRYFGCGEISYWNFEFLRSQIEFSGNVRRMHEIENVGKERYRVTVRAEGEEPFVRQYAIDWDVQRFVPVKFVSYDYLPPGGKPTQIATVNWRSIDGQFVPQSARFTLRKYPQYFDRIFALTEEIEVEIHWFSFNTKLPEELFDEKLLHDRKKLDELLNIDVFEANRKDKSTRE